MAKLKMAQDLDVGDVLDHNEIVTTAPKLVGTLVRFDTDRATYCVHTDTMWWVHPQPPEFM